MVTLYLLRHAKTKIATRGIADVERALTRRGMQDAARVGTWMRDSGIRPTMILCSDSRRTRETLAAIIGRIEGPCRIEIETQLYTFASEVLQRRLASLAKGPAGVMMIGHNPALEDLASALAGTGETSALTQLHRKFPTCGFAELSFDTDDWRTVKVGSGHLVRAMVPGDD